MTRPMCSKCSIETNKAEWAKYPHMMDLCKMCQSFQDAIYKTIEDHSKLLEETAQIGKDTP